MTLEVGFCLVMPGHSQPTPSLHHTPHHDLVFKSVFSTGDDEAVADGVCVWIAGSGRMPVGSCVHHLAKCVEEDAPFSPRLRGMSIRLIERMWDSGFGLSELETIHLLNCLDLCMDDMEEDKLANLLENVMGSLARFKDLSIHYWHLLERLPWTLSFLKEHVSRAAELVSLLEEAEDWERLEVWMVFAWQSDAYGFRRGGSKDLECIKQVTLKYLRR